MENNGLMEMENMSLIDEKEINEVRVKIQNFQKLLHKEPTAEDIKINKQANNSKYIPISFLEMKLDEMFFGLWSTKNFISSTVANELIGSLELWYFHPTARTWLCRIGAGAVMVQYKKDSDIMDLANKIKNTLSKDYPHLKAECFRNACLSIGKIFGRDLNREFEDQYNPVIKETKKIDEKLLSDLKIKLSEFSVHKDLHTKAIAIKTEYVKNGLDEETVYEMIKNRLDELKK